MAAVAVATFLLSHPGVIAPHDEVVAYLAERLHTPDFIFTTLSKAERRRRVELAARSVAAGRKVKRC